LQADSGHEVIPVRILLNTEAVASEQAAKRLPYLRLVILHCDDWY